MVINLKDFIDKLNFKTTKKHAKLPSMQRVKRGQALTCGHNTDQSRSLEAKQTLSLIDFKEMY